MAVKKVTVLGAGNAGFALAFHLGHLGFEVALFEHPDFKQSIEPVAAAGNEMEAVEAEGEFKAKISGKTKLALVTSDIAEAITFGEVIMIIVPAFGQVPIFELALPHIRDGQILVSLPGNFASLQYARVMKEKGISKNITFVDTDSIPYACRRLPGNKVFISGMKLELNAGVYPSDQTDAVLAAIAPCFTLKLVKNANVIEACFNNMNMILHPPPCLFNTGWIEVKKGEFSFYGEGCSPSVCKVMDAVDAERCKIASLLGFKARTLLQIHKGWYGESGKDTSYDHIQSCDFYTYFRAPPSLENRYISEDLCYVLIPILNLAKRYEISTPVTDAMILLAKTLTGKDLKESRDFAHVVKPGENAAQMHQRLASWK